MKRFLTITLALITALSLAACNAAAPVETVDTKAETSAPETTAAVTTTPAVAAAAEVAEEEAAEEVFAQEMAIEEAVAEITVKTTAAETAAKTTKQEPAICGSYRSVETAYPLEDGELEQLIAAGEEPMVYDYINISQFDDGGFQVEFRLAIGGSGNDYAVFDTETLGTANWYSFYFDGDMGVPQNNGPVTVTADGNTAWVTFDGGEAQEFRKTE
jgi:hypothetical protein